MTRPTFIIVGAAKCGTSNLAVRLNQHPDVFVVTAPKQPHFFTYNFARGWTWYQSLFLDAAGATAIGESSPTYTAGDWPECPGQMAAHLPQVKLIYLVRHPLERIAAHWMEDLQSGFFPQIPFPESVRSHPHLVASSLYWEQIGRYRHFFPDDRILVLFQEDLARDTRAALRACFRFLGVDPDVHIPDTQRRVNVRADLRRATSALKVTRAFGRRLLGEAAVARVPRSVKIAVNKLLGARIQPPEWDPTTRGWVLDRVRDDSKSFLQHHGKPEGFWSLTPP